MMSRFNASDHDENEGTHIAPARSDNGNKVRPYDIIGVGFGPSNLALAIAARELDPTRRCVFFERSPELRWHPGMLMDDVRMQISFLKDLVSLRNPASPYTFLQYVKAKNRLEMFVNLNEFRLTRLEYQDYLQWAADAFAGQVRYNSVVTEVRLAGPLTADGPTLFRVQVQNLRSGQLSTWFARNVVYAAGGRPRVPAGDAVGGPAVVHSSQFLPGFPERFGDHSSAYEFGVVGGGQSAGEIAAYLLEHYRQSRVHLLLTGYALRATDNNPFVNEQFYGHNADSFYGMEKPQRTALVGELSNTNYGVVEAGLLDELYRKIYADSVRGVRRLVVHPYSRVTEIRQDDDGAQVTVEHRFTGAQRLLNCAGVVLATGYDRTLDPNVFGTILPLIEHDDAGGVALSPNCRVKTTTELECGLYVQGFNEGYFGLGDTLLSLLPFRSKQIFTDICQRHPPLAPTGNQSMVSEVASYPPDRYVEHDVEKLYAVMRRFNFATVISADGPDCPVVTHVPLILDRTRGAMGVLFGHMDRTNPHVRLIDDNQILVLFHGPNSYMSPHVFKNCPLPTWNSMIVHVRGRGRLISERMELVRGLCGIAEQSDPGSDSYRLSSEDPRIDKLVGYIVGFEIDIEQLLGRFKLSQELNDDERQRAAQQLARTAARSEHQLIGDVVGLPISNGHHTGFQLRHVEPIDSWRS